MIPTFGTNGDLPIAALRTIAMAILYGPGDPDWIINEDRASPPVSADATDRCYSRFKFSSIPFVQSSPDSAPFTIRFAGSALTGRASLVITSVELEPVPDWSAPTLQGAATLLKQFE